jgi:hypothetical protein
VPTINFRACHGGHGAKSAPLPTLQNYTRLRSI